MASPPGVLRRVRSMAILLTGLLLAVPMLPVPAAAVLVNPAIPWDVDGDGYAELALAAPGENNGSVINAGAVTLLSGTSKGPTISGAQTLSQSTPGIIGVNEPQDLFGSGMTSCDFNRDGYADLAVGAAGERIGSLTGPDAAAGTVSILYGSATGVRTTGNQLLDPSQRGLADTWGTVLECGDLNGDQFADLVIGPGFCCFIPSPPDCCLFEEHPLGVTVVYGSASGLDASAGTYLTGALAAGQPDPNPRYGAFGTTVAVGDLDGDGFDELVVTAREDPGTGFYVFAGDPNGVDPTTPTYVPLFPDLSDRFFVESAFDYTGETAIGDFNGDGRGDLVLGIGTVSAPLCTFNGNCPGSVLVLPGSASGPNLDAGKVWHANTPGVAGVPNDENGFGVEVATGDLNSDGRDDLAIGIPGKSIGSTRNAGGVTVLYGSGTGLTAAGSQIWTESSPGVPGLSETRDRFGSAVLISRLRGSAGSGLTIGIGYENVGSVVDAGAALVLLGGSGGLTATKARTWTQNATGVPGTSETKDWFGLPSNVKRWPGPGREDFRDR